MPRFSAYPRPLLRRSSWTSLDGIWEFAIDADAKLTNPADVRWKDRIEVPFSPETPASGIGDTSLFKGCWYRRTFRCAAPGADQAVILHFGAVDYQARVWVDGKAVARHEGGYTPFSVDVTGYLDGDDGDHTGSIENEHEHEIVVNALDDPDDLAKPRGKQDWQLEPHQIWYPRTSGIWQTVWFEVVPRQRIETLQWNAEMRGWEVRLDACIEDGGSADLRLRVRLTVAGRQLADDVFSVVNGEVSRGVSLADPGIDDYRNELLWRPSRPTLIDAQLQLLAPDGTVLDEASSYTAMRCVQIEGDVFLLNGRPLQLRLVLDQGVWPQSGLTPPDDDAFGRDIELVQAMGFNGVRLHQKVEDPRFLAEADRRGLLVWSEMPSTYRFTSTSVRRLVQQWHDVVLRDVSHPCIVTWVPFNESWGVPDLPGIEEQRHLIRVMYHLTRALDASRPVSGNDGWESTATDFIGVHDYDQDVERLRLRYASHDVLPHLFGRERPGGRRLTLEDLPERPVVLSEFGGITYPRPTDDGPGGDFRRHPYAESEGELGRKFRSLLTAIRDLPLLAGFCYTQFADTYQERNGLLYADRTPKIPLAEIAEATKRAPLWIDEDM